MNNPDLLKELKKHLGTGVLREGPNILRGSKRITAVFMYTPMKSRFTEEYTAFSQVVNGVPTNPMYWFFIDVFVAYDWDEVCAKIPYRIIRLETIEELPDAIKDIVSEFVEESKKVDPEFMFSFGTMKF